MSGRPANSTRRLGRLAGGLLIWLGGLVPAAPAGNPAVDADRDGIPDAAELISDSDRNYFRRWFVAIAESQFYRRDHRWPEVHRDCAGLICFACREALKRHDSAWLREFRYLTAPSIPDPRRFRYPAVPVLGPNLFRIKSGSFQPDDLTRQAFAPSANANCLLEYNCIPLGTELTEDLLPGDLLFFRNLAHPSMPFHAMVLTGLQVSRQGTLDAVVVYHTGPQGDSPGEVRRAKLSGLNRHPDPAWQAKPGNPHFLGYYRLKILDHRIYGGPGDE